MRAFFAVLILLAGFAAPRSAFARDPCFDHNGSMMRLVERGGRFTIFYEEPRAVLRRAGVKRGTVLAYGRSTDGGFTGVAHRYSRHCLGHPQEYPVSGYFQDERTIVFHGERAVREACRPTGRYASDELLFYFVGAC